MYTQEDYEVFCRNLEEKYPEMFEGFYGGIDVEVGWWHIVESLCRKIHAHVEWKNELKEKYNRGDGCPPVKVIQIKEKFGGLRFYYDGGDDTIAGMVRLAESWADHSCQRCGNYGKLRPGGWMLTLCDKHEEERNG